MSWAFTENQRKAIVHCHYPQSKRVETQGVRRYALSYGIIWGAFLPKPQVSILLKANKLAFERAGMRSKVACQDSLDTSIVLWGAFCKEICTQKDCKLLLFIRHSRHSSSSLAFCGYTRLVKVRQLRQILPSSLASVRRHLVDRTPVGRKILKPTPKIFGAT